jgi:hypothetical protein
MSRIRGSRTIGFCLSLILSAVIFSISWQTSRNQMPER